MRPVLRLIPLVLLGGLAAFLLVGPVASLFLAHAAGTRPQISPRPTVSASPLLCPNSLPLPPPAAAGPSPLHPALPFAVWVNAPLGLNLRTGPTTASVKITLLGQGTQANADNQTVDAAGARWYHVTLGSQSGWVNADFVVLTSILPVSGNGWSLMLPQRYQTLAATPALTDLGVPGEALPFLRIQTATGEGPAVELPARLNPSASAVPDHTKQIQVWSYTVLEHVSRVALDTCKVPSAGARPDGGWPYMTSVAARSSQRTYRFTFFTPEPDSGVVTQVLDSISLS